MKRDCEHGNLARSCDLCGLTAEINRLEAALQKIKLSSSAKSYDQHRSNGSLENLFVEIQIIANIALNK